VMDAEGAAVKKSIFCFSAVENFSQHICLLWQVPIRHKV